MGRSFMWIAVCVFQLLLDEQKFVNGDCWIKPPANNKKFKIYLNVFHWLTPIDNFNGDKDIIAEGTTVDFTCENGFVDDSFLEKSYTFQCTDEKFNETFCYEDLLCKSDFHKNTKTFQISSYQLGSDILKCDGKHLEVYQVGTEQPDGSIKHLYKVCFDRNVMRTKFVYQPRRSERLQRIRDSRRDVWGFDRFGSSAWERLKLTDGYVSRIQKIRITNSFPNRYNKRKKYPYTFNRGHLAPYGDFMYPEDKKASCQYINVAPQWKEFNGNSWALIERETRDLVDDNPIEWEIYTGTYGSIPTTRGPLFVSPFFDSNGRFLKGFVPVPKLYWKLVRNVVYGNLSRAFVGVNNPELKSPEEFTDKYLICQPKANDRPLFRGNEFLGFTYECGVDEFLENLAREERIVKVRVAFIIFKTLYRNC